MSRSLSDTDVFVCLLYRVCCQLEGFRPPKSFGSYVTQELEDQYCHSMLYTQHWGTSSHSVFPALHALTECDTTNNISTKLAALNESYPQNFISDPQL